MAIDKIIYQDSNELMNDAMRRNGDTFVRLIELEKGVKSASSDIATRELLEKYRPENDKTACIHLIAMGDSDYFGPNRNGDYFAGDVLQKTASTFVTHGHMFREHRNKDPKKAIGSVKWAGYNPDMHRVELIVHMDKDKAEEEYEMAKKGSALSFSMSCRVPNDRCSICGNKAKNVMHYCDHLSGHMGQYMDGFKKYAFAYNDEPTFFDISRVKVPADRIARHLEYMFAGQDGELAKAASYMCKAASANSGVVIPSAYAAMAEGVNLGNFSLTEQNFMAKMASAEEYIHDLSNAKNLYTDRRAYDAYEVYPFCLMEKFSSAELDTVRSVNPGTLFREMAKRASLLSFPAFCQYISGNADVTATPLFKKACLMLPDVFSGMMPHIYSMTPRTGLFHADSEVEAENDPNRGDLVDNVMESAEEKFSIREAPARKRVVRITISIGRPSFNPEEELSKAASAVVDVDNAIDLARSYGQYQLAALSDMRDMHGESVVNDKTFDLIAGANSVMFYDQCGA